MPRRHTAERPNTARAQRLSSLRSRFLWLRCLFNFSLCLLLLYLQLHFWEFMVGLIPWEPWLWPGLSFDGLISPSDASAVGRVLWFPVRYRFNRPVGYLEVCIVILSKRSKISDVCSMTSIEWLILHMRETVEEEWTVCYFDNLCWLLKWQS